MSTNRPRSTWWRRVPRSRTGGSVTIVALAVAFAAGVYALATGVYTTTPGVILEIVVVILLAWSIISVSARLAALRSTSERR
ncbi:hypothetical protein FB559_6114 [Actinoallomurus bryophytorum]|uniref:Uncharacterized protein n=1 Tax=Actinoallomurus bryophytorum TaxID=1490222 RepID=A0A543CTP4_9ACTN|nr:hypothetical protein [Actinoallomurus bryophytorum]TQM00401.1 hypothetical protein FB559_6114 [Actinoallomurus bryophytorum]